LTDFKLTIAICDGYKQYAIALGNKISEMLNNVCSIRIVTNLEKLVEIAKDTKIDVLIISEYIYDSVIGELEIGSVMIIGESENRIDENITYINRYQDANSILSEILKELPADGIHGFKKTNNNKLKVIGIYSPIRRCLQTTFAITLGQMIAQKHKVLYMNFENFSGLSGLLNQEFDSDLADVLYFFDCDKSKLEKRIKMTIHKIGDMDFLPPAKSYIDTYGCTGSKWIDLFLAIEEATDYEYLILDLTDAMQGLIEVLSYCRRIYTMVMNDRISEAKLMQYKDWIRQHSYADIISKTKEFDFPTFTDIPLNPQLLTKSELGRYVKAIVNEDIYEEVGNTEEYV